MASMRPEQLRALCWLFWEVRHRVGKLGLVIDGESGVEIKRDRSHPSAHLFLPSCERSRRSHK